jgi:superfamily II DNA or RNA helicase
MLQNIDIKLEDFLPAYPFFDRDFSDKNDPKNELFNIYKTPDGKEFDTYNNINYRKLEFEKLDVFEKRPEHAGIMLKHQDFISRFLSPLTPNKEVLLFHQVGTGKTCSAAKTSELAKEINQLLKKTLILVKGSSLKKNFVRELAFQCTNNKYIPDNFDQLTKGEQVLRLNKLVHKQYEIDTFEIFAKKMSKYSDEFIKKEYSNRVVIIDEVHHLREQNKKEGIDVYFQIHRFLHLLENRIIMLLSGTPMRDKPEEFASVMNLILPLYSQMPTSLEFMKVFFEGDELVNKGKFREFIRGRVSYLRSMDSGVVKIFNGELVKDMKKISVVPLIMDTTQLEHYKKAFSKDTSSGEVIKNIDNAPESKKEGLYDNSRQSSVFVFPDGTYGTRGFTSGKWINKTKNGYRLTKEFENILTDNGKASPMKMIKILSNYSCKFAKTIEEIILSPKDNCFVYCKYVKGSGAILFGEILKLFSFEKFRIQSTKKNKKKEIKKIEEIEEMKKEVEIERKENIDINSKLDELLRLEQEKEMKDLETQMGEIGDEEIEEKEIGEKETQMGEIGDEEMKDLETQMGEIGDEEMKDLETQMGEKEIGDEETQMGEIKEQNKSTNKRIFVVLTSETSSDVETDKILNELNHKSKSRNGHVIIGSQVIGEGKSLFNIRKIFIITPHWNNAETEQAIGRGIRIFSHFDLPENERNVQIFRLCALSGSIIKSIDYIMYKLSEDKEYKSKQIERLVKEESIDCVLNKKRNLLSYDKDFSRECEYARCNYKCSDTRYSSPDDIDSPIEDTFNLFYAEHKTDKIIEAIKILFKKRFAYDLSEILANLSETSPISLLRTLKFAIERNVSITNKYGFPCFLRERKNLFFLVDDMKIVSSFPLLYYTEHPNIQRGITLSEGNVIMQCNYSGQIMDSILQSNNEKYIHSVLEQLDPRIQEMLIENCISSTNEKRKNIKKTILDFFKPFITKLDDEVISTLLNDKNIGSLRKYSDKTRKWESSNERKIYKDIEVEKLNLELNPHGYYGEIRKDKKFRIWKIQKDIVDSREKSRGPVCLTLNPLYKIVQILLDLKIDPPVPTKIEKTPESIEYFLEHQKKNQQKILKSHCKLFKKKEIEEMSDKNFKRIYYWFISSNKKTMCNTIQKWFETRNLIQLV